MRRILVALSCLGHFCPWMGHIIHYMGCSRCSVGRAIYVSYRQTLVPRVISSTSGHQNSSCDDWPTDSSADATPGKRPTHDSSR